MRKVPLEELMDTLIHEVELLAKEKEAEAAGVTHETAASSDGHAEPGWELIGHAPDEHSTIVRDIPVLPTKR
jgi:(E)-4-hydroxy-3-methylbut-2-enyl-diphosphate synthase